MTTIQITSVSGCTQKKAQTTGTLDLFEEIYWISPLKYYPQFKTQKL
jgi:hypothetical protein